MMAAVVSIFYSLVAFLQISSLKKSADTKKIIIFSLVLTAAYVISILLVFGIKIPSINRAVGDIVLSLTGEQ